MGNKREIRNTTHQVVFDEENRIVEGYALLFDTDSDGLSFDEKIERGSLDGVIEKSDVFALLNHDESRGVLARSKRGKGSLELIIDDKGLLYRFEAPRTSLGDELIESIKRGDVDESSFAFTVGKDEWRKGEDGRWKRSIQKIEQLYDVSPVYSAAYSATSVYMRGKEQAEEELRKQEERVKKEGLISYWADLEDKLKF